MPSNFFIKQPVSLTSHWFNRRSKRTSRHTIVPTTLDNERRFPNEIFVLIIENLINDQSSLGTIALVCRDLAFLSRPYVFREVKISDTAGVLLDKAHSYARAQYQSLTPFAGLLRNWNTVNDIVRVLEFYTTNSTTYDEVLDSWFILQTLPSLVELRINRLRTSHLLIIRSSLCRTLKVLLMHTHMVLQRDDFQLFQNMLDSLAVVEILGISGMGAAAAAREYLEPALTLPNSLRVVSFIEVDSTILRRVGKGFQGSSSSHPPTQLRYFITGCPRRTRYDNMNELICRALWRRIDFDTQVVLEMGDTFSDQTPEMLASLKVWTFGLVSSKLILICGQSGRFPALLYARFIPSLPDFVWEICIAIDISRFSYDPQYQLADHEKQDWAELDSTLLTRRRQGLLHRIYFRCTRRGYSYRHSASFYEKHPEDRSILNYVTSLLPRSNSVGLIEVDHNLLLFD